MWEKLRGMGNKIAKNNNVIDAEPFVRNQGEDARSYGKYGLNDD